MNNITNQYNTLNKSLYMVDRELVNCLLGDKLKLQKFDKYAKLTQVKSSELRRKKHQIIFQ